ncbi:isochorismate synthase [Amycolatopsis lurida]
MTTTAIPTHESTLYARTREIDAPDLLALLPSPHRVHSWVRQGEGIVGWGEAARVDTGGPARFEDAERAWRRLVGRMEIDDEVGLPGTGPVAFASFGFGDDPGHSVLTVPSVLIGRRAGRAWITTIRSEDAVRADVPTPVTAPGTVRWREPRLPADRWRDVVAEIVPHLRAGALDKVVLARDLLAEADEPIDPRFLLRRLASRHPDCWTFAVAGLVGTTPELLLRRQDNQVTARVLAGSTWPGADEDLLRSAALREEHRFAVESLLSSLVPHCTSTKADGPFVLSLPSIAHLATDVTGDLAPERATLLEMAGAVHPTAAVGGTPRTEAVRLIAAVEGREGLDRGRYAGPVGWVGADGDGELGIALRCAQLSGRQARLFAGCGLIAQSDPDTELRETDAKFAAMREALDD